MSVSSSVTSRRAQRSAWYLLSGFVLGVVIGLLIAGVIAPFKLQDISPAQLLPQAKDQYRLMIARVFVADQNLIRAQSRLMLLGDENSAQALSKQAQQMLAVGDNEKDIAIVAELALKIANNSEPTP